MPLPRPVNQNTPEKITNALQLQSLSDREIHARFGLSSNLAVQVCRSIPPYTGGVGAGDPEACQPTAAQPDRSEASRTLRLCLKRLSGGVLTAPLRVHFGLRKNPLGGSVKQKLGKQMLKLASGAAVETFGPCPSKTLS